MYEFDTRGAAVIDMAGADGTAGNLDSALTGLDKAGGDTRKRGLARAILADDGVNEPRRKGYGNIGERHDLAIEDRHIAAGECGLCLTGHQFFPSINEVGSRP
jgi:hypothetical protein